MHSVTITSIEPVYNGNTQLSENGLLVYRVRFNAIADNGTIYENNYYQWAIDATDQSSLVKRCNDIVDYLVAQDSNKVSIPDTLASLVV